MGWKVDGGQFPQCLDGKGWWIHDDSWWFLSCNTLPTTKRQTNNMWKSWRPKKYSLWRWFGSKSGLDWYCSHFQSLFYDSYFSWRQATAGCTSCGFSFFPFLLCPGFTPTEANENKTHGVIARHSEVHGELEALSQSVDIDCGSWWLLTVWISEGFCFRKKTTAATHLYFHMLLACCFIMFNIYGGVLVDIWKAQVDAPGTPQRRWKRSISQRGWWQQAWRLGHDLLIPYELLGGVWLRVADIGELLVVVFVFCKELGRCRMKKSKIESVHQRSSKSRDAKIGIIWD